MSCCISSSVCCLLAVGSMSGIALGYNYSLAEYMDLKETNVSIYLKRGVFDDEVTDLEWRRAGHMPVRAYENQGLKALEQMPLEQEGGSAIQSRRNLDDSVIDGFGDQRRYEGSLYKLTAKSLQTSTAPHIEAHLDDMQKIVTSYSRESLDGLKAVQSAIDARKAMAQLYRGTTISPVPTYPFKEAENLLYPGHKMQGGRRGMENINYNEPPTLNPARYAVPNENIGSKRNWAVPKYPNRFVTRHPQEHYADVVPVDNPTFPSPITLRTGPIRPTTTSSLQWNIGPDAKLTRTKFFTLFSTAPSSPPEPEMIIPDNQASVETIKEQLRLANEMPIRKQKPKPEEEYDYDIKGLPVRKRRSIVTSAEVEDNILQEEKVKKTVGSGSYSIKSIFDIFNPISIKNLLIPTNSDETHSIKDSDKGEIHETILETHKQSLEAVSQPAVLERDVQINLGYKTKTPNKPIENTAERDISARLISKIKSVFDMNGNDKQKADIKDDSLKVITQSNENFENIFINNENHSGEAASTEDTKFGDDNNMSQNIFPVINNDKDIIQPTSSILVKMLLSTST